MKKTQQQSSPSARMRECARRRAIELAFHARPANGGSPQGYDGQLLRQRKLAAWIWEQQFHAMVSINSNDSRFGYDRGRSAIKKLDALLDRYFVGKDWCKRNSSERVVLLAVPERAGGELHYHVFVKLPHHSRRDVKEFQQSRGKLAVQLRSKKIFPRGDVHIQALQSGNEFQDNQNQFKFACYAAKDLWQTETAEHYILGSEFRSR